EAAHQVVRRTNVDLPDFIVLAIGDPIPGLTEYRRRRIIDQYVDAAGLCHRGIEKRRARSGIADIALDGDGIAAIGPYLFRDFSQRAGQPRIAITDADSPAMMPPGPGFNSPCSNDDARALGSEPPC